MCIRDRYTACGGNVQVKAEQNSFFVKIDIIDDGIGIEKEEIPKMCIRDREKSQLRILILTHTDFWYLQVLNSKNQNLIRLIITIPVSYTHLVLHWIMGDKCHLQEENMIRSIGHIVSVIRSYYEKENIFETCPVSDRAGKTASK